MSGLLPAQDKIEVEGVMPNMMLKRSRLVGIIASFVGTSSAQVREMRRLRVLALLVFAVAEIKWVNLRKRGP